MSGSVYVLCGLTALVCAALLVRGYWRSGMRLLLWSALCFVGLALDNAFLFLDLVVFPQFDLSAWRNLPALSGLTLLLYGLIWDTR